VNPLESFEEQRPLLFGIAYRMLSSAMDAEDIVQEAYLRYQRLAQPPDNPRAYLRTVVTRLCLDQLKSAREQREQYYGEWLPEPILTE
jgi:RNA polymerase sigma-70 factor (ECF subfamily)